MTASVGKWRSLFVAPSGCLQISSTCFVETAANGFPISPCDGIERRSACQSLSTVSAGWPIATAIPVWSSSTLFEIILFSSAKFNRGKCTLPLDDLRDILERLIRMEYVLYTILSYQWQYKHTAWHTTVMAMIQAADGQNRRLRNWKFENSRLRNAFLAPLKHSKGLLPMSDTVLANSFVFSTISSFDESLQVNLSHCKPHNTMLMWSEDHETSLCHNKDQRMIYCVL